MAFLSKGVKSPCPRGVLKILIFVLGVKNCKFLSEGGLKKRFPSGATFCQNKLSEGGKMGEKKLTEEGKIDKKMSKGGVKSAGKLSKEGKIGQNCLGVTRKKHVRGG